MEKNRKRALALSHSLSHLHTQTQSNTDAEKQDTQNDFTLKQQKLKKVASDDVGNDASQSERKKERARARERLRHIQSIHGKQIDKEHETEQLARNMAARERDIVIASMKAKMMPVKLYTPVIVFGNSELVCACVCVCCISCCTMCSSHRVHVSHVHVYIHRSDSFYTITLCV